jgi:hypothetical protein
MINPDAHHFPLLELGDILLKNEFSLDFNFGLLPDGMLRE